MIRKLWRLAALVTIGSKQELLLVHFQLPLFFLKEVALSARVKGFVDVSAQEFLKHPEKPHWTLRQQRERAVQETGQIRVRTCSGVVQSGFVGSRLCEGRHMARAYG